MSEYIPQYEYQPSQDELIDEHKQGFHFQRFEDDCPMCIREKREDEENLSNDENAI